MHWFLHPANLLDSHYSSSFFSIPWDFSTFLIMLSASNAGSLQSRWCVFCLFYYFVLLQHPVQCWAEVMRVHILSLFLMLRGKAVFYYIMLAVGFFISCFLSGRQNFSTSWLLRVFIKNECGCWFFSKYFSLHLLRWW